MAPSNRAAWLKSKESPSLVVGPAPYSPPGPNELVIRTRAVGVNPVDVFIQQTGFMIEHVPTIIGSDVAGTVEEVGSGLTSTYKPGDRVIGRAHKLEGDKYAAYQEYVVVNPPLLAKIPDHIKVTEAVVLPIGMVTASACLFEAATLGLELPPGEGGKAKTLLIWGASSTIGLAGVQLATAAGYEVFGVASRHNHELIKSLGASRCFDRQSETVVDDIVTGLKGKDIVGAYDAVSKEDTILALAEILHRSGGRKYITTVLPFQGSVGHGVEIKPIFATNVAESGVGQRVWHDFLEPGLASGAVQCKPDAEIVGSGLESVQKGIDLLAKGVSAKKIVVSLED